MIKFFSNSQLNDHQPKGFLVNKHLLFILFFTLIYSMGCTKPLEAAEVEEHCPQPRFTEQAPPEFYNLKNPLTPTEENIKKGKLLYLTKSKPMPCKVCHGVNGDGQGPMAKSFKPHPRDFTCAKTIDGVPDGQLFWIIKNGSPGTGMMGFKALKDDQIWQIILYIRQLSTHTS